MLKPHSAAIAVFRPKHTRLSSELDNRINRRNTIAIQSQCVTDRELRKSIWTGWRETSVMWGLVPMSLATSRQAYPSIDYQAANESSKRISLDPSVPSSTRAGPVEASINKVCCYVIV